MTLKTSIVVSSYLGQFTRMMFGLDGQDQRQEELLLGCFQTIYRSLAQHDRAIGLVVDRDRGQRAETTLSYPWCKILVGKDVIPGEYPDLVIVPKEIGVRLYSVASDQLSVTQIDDHLILARRR